MDCEKFESAMMDELYGELDELTSAAAKRHVAGCARCAALLGGLRATRRLAAVPLVERRVPPERALSRLVDAEVARDRVEPRAETGLVLELGRVLHHADEGVLHHLLGHRRAPEIAQREIEERSLVPAHKDRERRPVPRLE